MTDRLVFLDIDGVLNHRAWFERAVDESPPNAVRERHQKIDPASVGLLNQLIVRTRAKVVISSTWRVHYSPEAMQALLARRGFIGEVVGNTPDLQRGGSTARRGNDILSWLRTEICVCGNDPEQIVILDDDSDMGELLPFLVRVDNLVGLTQRNIDDAVAVLLTKPIATKGTP